MFNFSSIKKSIADIKNQSAKLRSEIKQKIQQRENLKTSPLSREDLADQVCAMVDKQGDVYVKRLSMTLAFAHTNPFYNFAESHIDLISTCGSSATSGQIPKENLMWFLGDVLKQRLRAAIDIMDWPTKCGPPLSERQPAIEKLSKEIAGLEQQLATLREQSASAGIRIEQAEPAPTKREQAAALTERVNELVKSTPFPDHVIRGMLANGTDPLQEAKKVPARSLQ